MFGCRCAVDRGYSLRENYDAKPAENPNAQPERSYSGLRGWKDVIDVDFPVPGPITKDTVLQMQKHAGRYGGADVRVAMGLVYTTEDYESFRKRVLSKPLP